MATYVHTVIKKYPMSDEKLNSCREATASDPTLRAPIEYTKDEWSSKEKISSNISTLGCIRDELITVTGHVLKGTLTVVPSSLRREALQKSIEGIWELRST